MIVLEKRSKKNVRKDPDKTKECREAMNGDVVVVVFAFPNCL